MYKFKTKASAKKRFKYLSTNKIKAFCACRRHRLCGRNKTAKQQIGSSIIKDYKIVRKLIIH